MEEARAAAMAYYTNLSLDQKQAVQDFYRSLDEDGDGKVTSQEFKKACCNQNSLPSNLFEVLDKNNDGTLDLEECITFYYMIKGHRLVSCKGCGSCMFGLHFLCVVCYCVSKEKTYDLYCSCYRNNNFNHIHSYFLDNFALLRTELPADNTSTGAGNTSAGTGRSYYQSGDTSAGAGRSYYQHNRAAEAVETGVRVADAAVKVAGAASNAYSFGSSVASVAASGATVCTIM